jgi:hypothetical protein
VPEPAAPEPIIEAREPAQPTAAALPPVINVVLPEKVTVDAAKAIGPTFTDVESRDDMGRIKTMIVRPVSGVGPTYRRVVLHGEAGQVIGHQDELIEESTNG